MSILSKKAKRVGANSLSVVRGASGPILAERLVAKERKDRGWSLAFVFGLLAYSDKVDGDLARSADPSKWGPWLDQMADKTFALPQMYALAKTGEIKSYHWKIKLARDVGVTALRAFAHSNGSSTDAEELGKKKAAVEMLGLETAYLPITKDYPELTNAIFDVATMLNIASGLSYIRSFGKTALGSAEQEVAEPEFTS